MAEAATSRIISGDPLTFAMVDKGLGEFFFEQAEKHADNVFQIDGITFRRQTFSFVNRKSICLAKNLRKLAFTSEHMAVTCMRNTLNTVIPHIAILYLGATFAALDPDQIGMDWIHCLRIVNPQLIFVDEGLLAKMDECLRIWRRRPDIIVVGRSHIHQTLDELSEYGDDLVPFFPVRVACCYDTAIISFTSGMEDRPKAVCHSHFSLLNMTINYLEMDICNPSVILHNGTFFSLSTVLVLIRVFLSGGSKVVGNKFLPGEMLKTVQECKVSHCLLSPEIMKVMVLTKNPDGFDTSSLHHYVSTGSPIIPRTLLKSRILLDPIPVTSEYGTCEMGPIAAFDMTRDKELLNSLTSVGKCLNGIQIKILDEDTYNELGPDEEGEIWVKSPFCTRGYYNSSAPLKHDSDGFVRTGDYGSYDRSFCLFVVGRCSDNFMYGSQKVVPGNWERFLLRHPGIKEAAVLGVPDGRGEFRAGALVVLKWDCKAAPLEIDKFFTHTTPDRKILGGGVKVVKKLPRSFFSKLKRLELLKLFLETSE